LNATRGIVLGLEQRMQRPLARAIRSAKGVRAVLQDRTVQSAQGECVLLQQCVATSATAAAAVCGDICNCSSSSVWHDKGNSSMGSRVQVVQQ
jgi:hypothetical protein